ncbi:hypothetical protein PF005_g5682 [Phytophthora fragariae]|uniref:Secreted protein n=2 Tax=Phytophthora TaxID=4783 RepID=A0A6A3ETS8_9STRA|nr:hypothetical protein PF003_g30040 [Phytophthora fragariae]KAE9030245.1 hypothetical protein PR002_g9938 [Phytophthora rubi]KAE8935726.1 hypothetical protein PF009_g14337 [Phytophthora fragariae]KAE8985538.1 hypothetical protein PF011_g20352 [Phytophthora fragariae]KAE9034488.1 hypothetical protein PR001_g9716 [Phytophthora rubi]
MHRRLLFITMCNRPACASSCCAIERAWISCASTRASSCCTTARASTHRTTVRRNGGSTWPEGGGRHNMVASRPNKGFCSTDPLNNHFGKSLRT